MKTVNINVKLSPYSDNYNVTSTGESKLFDLFPESQSYLIKKTELNGKTCYLPSHLSFGDNKPYTQINCLPII